jgi:hypothetical protein
MNGPVLHGYVAQQPSLFQPGVWDPMRRNSQGKDLV